MTATDVDIKAASGPLTISDDDPWLWLAAGWRDLTRAPRLSLAYGAIFSFGSLGFVSGLIWLDLFYLLLPLGAGFMLVGPILAIGLYEGSRRLETGESVGFFDVLNGCRESLPRIMWAGGGLGLVMFAWMQIAALLFMLFFGDGHYPSEPQLMFEMLFYSPRGLAFIFVGSSIGAVIAFVVFAFSAISMPLLMERDVDFIAAGKISVDAVRHNLRPMLLWAALIGLFTATGIVTLFLGLIICFPLIGHSTWHAYRALVPKEAPGADQA
jgi:uncharacterized membrane protein